MLRGCAWCRGTVGEYPRGAGRGEAATGSGIGRGVGCRVLALALGSGKPLLKLRGRCGGSSGGGRGLSNEKQIRAELQRGSHVTFSSDASSTFPSPSRCSYVPLLPSMPHPQPLGYRRFHPLAAACLPAPSTP